VEQVVGQQHTINSELEQQIKVLRVVKVKLLVYL
jgi:hypothetical protein